MIAEMTTINDVEERCLSYVYLCLPEVRLNWLERELELHVKAHAFILNLQNLHFSRYVPPLVFRC